MILPSFVAGLLLASIVPAFRDATIRLLVKQIEILLRILADHGIHTIVCTPEEAYRCFARTEMDYLVLENFLLAKSAQPAGTPDAARRDAFEPD